MLPRTRPCAQPAASTSSTPTIRRPSVSGSWCSMMGGCRADAMDVGGALRDAREQRGLSLDRLSQTTKISVTILRAIENNRIEKLPDGIFLRGFLRAYAREVGLNPEETVRR